MAEVPSFWGLILKSGSSVDPEIPEGRFLTLSQVSLHAPNQGRVTLFCETNGTKYVLCNLEWERVEQVALNLQFYSEDSIKFSTTGKGEVHLIGHLGVEAPLYDSEDDLDEDEFREAMRHKGFAFDEEIDSDEGDSDEEGDYSPLGLQVNGKKLLPPTKDVSKEKSKKEKAAQPQKGAKQSAKQEKAEKPKKEKKPKNAEQAPKKAEKAEQTPKKAEQTPKKAEKTPKKAEEPKTAEQTPKKKDKTPKKRPAEGTPEGKEDGKKAKTEGAFTCVECSRSFVAESGLAAHQKAKHTPK
jgi:hypothetical protein